MNSQRTGGDLSAPPAVRDTRIAADNVWKRYGRQNSAIRKRGLSSLWSEVRGSTNADPTVGDHEFWALQNVSVAVGPGQSLGVMGLNGAGKSTLLRMMAGLSKPDLGSVSVNGPITALLDASGGFDEMLSGRENVECSPLLYRVPSGQRSDVLDQIVAFAGIGSHIDAPLRNYSKGMRMRLAFATAVNSHAETILIDEVVAVGDVGFQRKCFNHLRGFVGDGGSLVVVAHSTWVLESLCDIGLLLSDGLASAVGPIGEVTAAYAQVLADPERSARPVLHGVPGVEPSHGDADAGGAPVDALTAAPDDELSSEAVEESRGAATAPQPASGLLSPKQGRPVGFQSIELSGPDGGPVMSGETMHVRFTCDSDEAFGRVDLGVVLSTGDGQLAAAGANTTGGTRSLPAGVSVVEFELRDLPLVPGRWAARFALLDATTQVVLGMHGIDTPPLPFEVGGRPAEHHDMAGLRSAPLLRAAPCTWSVEHWD